MKSFAVTFVLCHVISLSWLAFGTSVSTKFLRIKNLELKCAVSPEPLILNSGDFLTCARACKQRSNCTCFVFAPYSSLARSGTCRACLAHSITGVRYSTTKPQAETWISNIGWKADPESGTYIPIPGALSIGRVLVVKGRVPVPAPAHFVLDIYDNNKKDIVIRFTCRFNFRQTVRRLRVSSNENGTWDVDQLNKSIFPFSEGKEFEINFLATQQGFMVYVDASYIHIVDKTIHMANDIGYLKFNDFYLHMIYY